MLYNRISDDMINSLKNKDKESLSTLRMLKSAIDLYKINNKLTEITDDIVIDIISKQIKTHKESIIQFEKSDRKDLVSKLQTEIELLKTYLPEQLSEEEIIKEIDNIFNEIKPNGKSDLGKVMKEASNRLKGKADFKLVSEIIQSKLN